MNKVFSLLAVMVFMMPVLFAQTGTTNVDIANRLRSFLAQQKTEKAYLQFDKPYYNAGDTIYFKAYITEGDRHQPSDLSGVLHVNLINTENKIALSIVLQNENGVCHGDFALPDSLPGGTYRVRAYTQWMRNSGEKNFFEKPLYVSSVNRMAAQAVKTGLPKIIPQHNDLQFFPEGGTLVIGINNKIAFKAIGTNGLGIEVKGIVLDDANKKIVSFSSTHAGMGYFVLNPFEDRTYKAHITFADNSTDIVDFPKASASGIALQVNNDSAAKAFVTVKANLAYYKANQDKNFLLVIYSAGKAMSAPFKLDDPIVTLTINKEKMPSGIATVTLFSQNEPVCERLLFVQNNDLLAFHISPGKTEYNRGEKVNVAMNVTSKNLPDSTGSFSVSVVNEDKVPADDLDERNILTDLLLTSDVKGYVEKPNYYFTDTDKAAPGNLDVLMLTQGYRDFEWKEVFDTNKTVMKYQPEKGLEIMGEVTGMDGIPLPGQQINLVPSSAQGATLTGASDKQGLFRFTNLIFTDTINFILNTGSSQKSPAKLAYLPNVSEPPVSPYLPGTLQLVTPGNIKMSIDSSKNYPANPSKGTAAPAAFLKEVRVTDNKIKNAYRTQSFAGSGNADQVLRAGALDEIQGVLTTRLNGMLNGVNFSGGVPYLQAPVLRSESSTTANAPMLIIVDGTEVNSGGGLFNIDQIDANTVETVEVLKYTGTSIYGVEGANGVMIITSKQEKGSAAGIAAVGVLPIASVGFYKARTFYSPQYNYTNANRALPGNRATLYWNPELKPGSSSSALFSYYNTTDAGTYKVVIEGMDNDGNIGRIVYRYKVN